jgi:hypothetical protein
MKTTACVFAFLTLYFISLAQIFGNGDIQKTYSIASAILAGIVSILSFWFAFRIKSISQSPAKVFYHILPSTYFLLALVSIFCFIPIVFKYVFNYSMLGFFVSIFLVSIFYLISLFQFRKVSQQTQKTIFVLFLGAIFVAIFILIILNLAGLKF